MTASDLTGSLFGEVYPQGVFGVCEGCGAVAWELLDRLSTMCMGCDPSAYRQDDDQDDCGSCGCVGPCEYDGER